MSDNPAAKPQTEVDNVKPTADGSLSEKDLAQATGGTSAYPGLETNNTIEPAPSTGSIEGSSFSHGITQPPSGSTSTYPIPAVTPPGIVK